MKTHRLLCGAAAACLTIGAAPALAAERTPDGPATVMDVSNFR